MSDIDKAIGNRRERAREAFWDAGGTVRETSIDKAVEVATRVEITDEVIDEAKLNWSGCDCRDCLHEIVNAAFRAAGFEVIK